MQYSINHLLAMEKSLRERLVQMNTLKGEVSKRTFWMTENKREEPVYDVKLVDKKVSEINKALFNLNHKIKEANAKTLIEIDLDYDALVSPIE